MPGKLKKSLSPTRDSSSAPSTPSGSYVSLSSPTSSSLPNKDQLGGLGNPRPSLPRSVEPRTVSSKNWDALDVFELVKTRELLHERFNQHQIEMSRQVPRTFVWRTTLKLLDRTDEELQALDETLSRKINDILATGRHSEQAYTQRLDELQRALVGTLVGSADWFACFGKMKQLSEQLAATQAQISEGEGWQATLIHISNEQQQQQQQQHEMKTAGLGGDADQVPVLERPTSPKEQGS